MATRPVFKNMGLSDLRGSFQGGGAPRKMAPKATSATGSHRQEEKKEEPLQLRADTDKGDVRQARKGPKKKTNFGSKPSPAAPRPF